MDNNVIFQTNAPVQNPAPDQSPPSAPVPRPENTTPNVPLEAPTGLPPDEPSFFNVGTIIKAVIGLIVILVIGFLIFSFASSRFTKSKAETVTLSYWGLWEDSRVMQGIISDFERQNPNVKVTYTKQDIKQYKERLLTRTQNGTGPDIFRFHNTWLMQLSGILAPFSSDVIAKEDFKKSFYPVIQTDLTKNGAIYGVPLGIDTLSLFINKEVFQAAGLQPPQTWDEFARYAKILTVKDESGKIKTSGAAVGTFDNITHAPDIISLFLIQNGTDIRNLSVTSKNAADALDFYTAFTKGDGNVWDETLDPSILAFAKGNLAMYFGYSWDIFTINSINPELSFSVSPVPSLPGRGMTIASYWAEGVSLKSKHQKEAMLFLKFLAKKETEQKLFTEISKTRSFGEPYARTELESTLKDNVLLYPFVSQAKTAVSSFFAADTYDEGLNTQMNNYLGNAVRSILGNTSTDTAVATLANGVSQVLQKYNQSAQSPKP